jgi:hypothetical protein
MRISTGRLGLMFSGLVVAITAVACGSSSPAGPTSTSSTASTAPTLTQIQTQIFDPGCTSCHSDVGRTPSSGLNLKSGAAFSNLVGVASVGLPGAVRVIAGNANGSYIVQKLEGAPNIAGLRMPRNGPPYLTDAQVKMIRDWITAGAPNN